MEYLTQKSCADFTELLAAKTSVPGGGGVAALAGALGAALCAMAGNFTVGKPRYASVEADIRSLLDRTEVLRLRFLELVDEDAEAFAPLARAYAIPASARRDALESAAIGACAAPMEMLERCAEVCAVLEEMLEKGSTLLISDVGCAALLCRAAMESAAMNVYVNTRLLRDRGRAAEIEARAETLTAGCSARAESIALSVKNRLKGGAAHG